MNERFLNQIKGWVTLNVVVISGKMKAIGRAIEDKDDNESTEVTRVNIEKFAIQEYLPGIKILNCRVVVALRNVRNGEMLRRSCAPACL